MNFEIIFYLFSFQRLFSNFLDLNSLNNTKLCRKVIIPKTFFFHLLDPIPNSCFPKHSAPQQDPPSFYTRITPQIFNVDNPSKCKFRKAIIDWKVTGSGRTHVILCSSIITQAESTFQSSFKVYLVLSL